MELNVMLPIFDHFFIIVFSTQLQELGHLCGLMPGEGRSSSAQLHTVIALVCGMGNDPHAHDDPPRDPHQDPSTQDTPMTRLKDALSSPPAFKKHFLVSEYFVLPPRLKEILITYSCYACPSYKHSFFVIVFHSIFHFHIHSTAEIDVCR